MNKNLGATGCIVFIFNVESQPDLLQHASFVSCIISMFIILQVHASTFENNIWGLMESAVFIK